MAGWFIGRSKAIAQTPCYWQGDFSFTTTTASELRLGGGGGSKNYHKGIGGALMMKCVICEKRPVKVNGQCVQCSGKIASMSKRKEQPRHFLTYRGHVVGLYPNGGKQLIPRLLRCSAERLPKGKTVDLNHYCTGYSREVIKRFKACVLQLAHA